MQSPKNRAEYFGAMMSPFAALVQIGDVAPLAGWFELTMRDAKPLDAKRSSEFVSTKSCHARCG